MTSSLIRLALSCLVSARRILSYWAISYWATSHQTIAKRPRPPLILGICCCLVGHAAADSETIIQADETIITATRLDLPAGALTGQVTVLDGPAIRGAAANTTDDLLRRVPGFSLFRRSSSAVAHPTTQGVSLRGIGASGASRSLVLLDGMPLNDPFGGWVQWSKVHPASLGRAEVLRGGGHVWGNYALSGIVSLISRAPTDRTYRLSATGGQGTTAALDLGLDHSIGATAISFEGGYYGTEGYPVVRPDQRGAIDGKADSQNGTARLRAFRPLGDKAALFVQAGAFTESRSNGTALTENNTRSGYLAANLDWNGGTNHWRLSSFAQKQRFDSFFSAQAADRQSENPALDQFDVPANALGLSLEWQRTLAAAHRLAAGWDLRRLAGETNEAFFFVEGASTRRRRAGGDQVLGGLFVNDTYTASPRWIFNAGLRFDGWRNGGGFRREWAKVDGEVLRDDTFDDQKDWVLSPRAGLRFKAAADLDLRAAAYRSFRTPTLNELYRPFRIGNDITAANPDLGPERLNGAEIGLDYAKGRFNGQATAYWNQVEDAVANLFVGLGPGQVSPCGFVPNGGACRQRQGVDRTRSRGIETEATLRLHPKLLATGAYLFVDSRIRRADLQPELKGKRLPQIARHQLNLGLIFSDADLVDAQVHWRYIGRQFEDPLNQKPLGGFAVLDLAVSRILYPNLEVFLRGENVLDKTYEVGVSGAGVVTIGTPRRLGLGLRWKRD
jgi:outer membrane receptor protein involved in Fe transport